jgi:DNA topoisomerase-1
VYLDGRHLRPTDLGFVVTDMLSEHFPRIMDIEFTANIEEQLDRVEQGDERWVDLLRAFYGPFEESLQRAETEMRAMRMPARELDEKCPECGKPQVIRTGRRGPFRACSGYPECRYSAPVDGEGTPRPAAQPTDEKCEECGEPMLLRTGRRGPFLGCSAYPKCRHTRPLAGQDETPASEKSCPQCGKPLAVRRSRRGPFLGCTGYPECTHTEPFRGKREPATPTGETCEKCGAPMVVRQGRRGSFAGCSAYPKCRNTRPLAQEQPGESEPESAPG